MDYAPIDVELRFRGGQRQETVATTDVEIIQDGVAEPTEEFLVDVVATRNSIVLTPVVTVRIIGIGKLFFTHAIHHYNGSNSRLFITQNMRYNYIVFYLQVDVHPYRLLKTELLQKLVGKLVIQPPIPAIPVSHWSEIPFEPVRQTGYGAPHLQCVEVSLQDSSRVVTVPAIIHVTPP